MSGPDQDFFDDAFAYTLVNEGGFSNDVGDHGGATRYGITRADASRWYKRPVSIAEMQALPLEVAKDIYRAWYFDANGCNHMDAREISISIFDIGVVCGIGTSARMAQEVCNILGHQVSVDRQIGPKTLLALNSVAPHDFVKAFADRVAARFHGIVNNNESQRKFLRGWLNRAHRLLTLIKA